MASIETVIENLSFEELLQAKSMIESRLNALRHTEIKKAREELRAKAAQLGIEPEALLTDLIAKSSSKVAAKYRDHHNPKNTWTGRGKQPNWLKEKISEGASLDDFLI